MLGTDQCVFPRVFSALLFKMAAVHSIRRHFEKQSENNLKDPHCYLAPEKKLKFLKRFKGLPSSVLEEIYFKGIVPSITYCIAIWASCSPSTFKVLEHLHLKAAKLIHKLPSETPDSDILDLVKWKPLGYIYKRRLASIMYQVFHSSLPDQLTALFETRNTNNNYN